MEDTKGHIVGILTYCRALNFGANLQACSTYSYLKNHGYVPMLIDYSPANAIHEELSCPKEQVKVQRDFQSRFLSSVSCHSAEEVANVLMTKGIRNVIIGSDAVVQHHPFLARLAFSSKHLISFRSPTADKMFPNPYWGNFLDFCQGEMSLSMMSVSCQQSDYRRFPRYQFREMMRFLSRFRYISVRDTWTQNMFKCISSGKIIPDITPDPVFAFNQNVHLLPTREEIVQKYSLPNKYILLALRKGNNVPTPWVERFEAICNHNGYTCLGFPFPYGFTNNNTVKFKVNLPLSPIDWYSIIRYADGYVGYNMHTIVSSLHNSVPCYSMDQYGVRVFPQTVVTRSSKIYDILSIAGFPEYRTAADLLNGKYPEPETVFDKLMRFDKNKCDLFAAAYYEKYLKMMSSIESHFIL